jgi:metacaspase-1
MFRLTVILIILVLVMSGDGCVSHAIRVVVSRLAQPLSSPQAKPRKRALLVGVSEYCRDETGSECNRTSGKYWWDLNSGNDVDELEQILTSEKFAFKAEDVKVLKTRADTTRDNILKTFKSFLIDQTSPGDIVYFHFSGHGTQVEDDEKNGENPKVGDELDGLDESLVPSDYETRDNGKKNIRDDELERLLAQLSGRHVTVTVDSCYSGTITRGGVRLVRGMKLRRSVATNTSGRDDGSSGIFQEGTALPASLVVISAARNNQLASETVDKATKKDLGALTYSLIRSLPNAGPETTYRDLFERVSDEVTRETRDQHPQLEGSRDNILFSGTVLPPRPYINLQVEQRKVLLRAGSLQAMTKGSRFSIYAPGNDSKAGSPIAQAEIVNVGPTMSVLNVTPVPDDQMLAKLRTARAFETFHNFGDARLKVLIDAGGKAVLGDKGLRELRALDLLTVADDTANDWNVRICRKECPDEKLVVGQEKAGPGVVTLMRDDGSIIARIAEAPKLLESIRTALEGEARWRFIKTLRNETDPNLRIRMRLVPVTDVKQDPITQLAADARVIAEEVQPSDGNQLVLHEGDTVMLEVMNLGPDEIYISILDLRSDGQIGPLFPHPLLRSGVNENRITVRNDKNGQPLWQRIPFPFVLRIDKPYGNEVFKAVVTRQPADFSPLFSQTDAEDIQHRRPRGTVRGDDEAKSPLGQLLLTLTTGKLGSPNRGRTRSGPSDGRTRLFGAEDAARMGVPLEGWATAEITFQARPPRQTSPSGSQ